jgi:hypothetical protein
LELLSSLSLEGGGDVARSAVRRGEKAAPDDTVELKKKGSVAVVEEGKVVASAWGRGGDVDWCWDTELGRA